MGWDWTVTEVLIRFLLRANCIEADIMSPRHEKNPFDCSAWLCNQFRCHMTVA